MFDDEIEKEKEKEPKKKSPKGSVKTERLGTGNYGYMPCSYVYGKDYPTCWSKLHLRQVF